MMVAKVASTLSAALMVCAFVVVGLSKRPDDIVIRDGEGVPRVVIGKRADGAWGLEVNGPDGKARVSLGYADAANTTYATFATGSADRGAAFTVSEDSGRVLFQLGPFKAAGGEESGDTIILESRRASGLSSIGVYAGAEKPRIVLQSQESQSALIITDEEFKPRASFLRRGGEFGWTLWGDDGATKAQVIESADGLEVDLGK